MIYKENLITIARYLYKYSTCLPSIAVQRLLNVDVIRNNYTKSTIYNLIIATRRAIKEEKRNTYMPKALYNLIIDIKNNKISKELNIKQKDENYIMDSTYNINDQEKINEPTMDIQKPKEISVEQIAEELKRKKEKLKIKYNTIKEEKEKQIEDIETTANNKVSEIRHELGILGRAYSKAEIELDAQLVSLTATLLLNQTDT